MSKPVGGRGKVAKYPTIMRRIPEGIKHTVEYLADLYRSEVWDGQVESLRLNPMSGYDSRGDVSDIGSQLLSIVGDKDEWLESLPSEVRDEFLVQLRAVLGSSLLKGDGDTSSSIMVRGESSDFHSDDELLGEQDRELIDSELVELKELESVLNLLDIRNNPHDVERSLVQVKRVLKKLSRLLNVKDKEIQERVNRENEALDLLGEKPRRSMRKKKG